CACSRFHVTPKLSHLQAVKRIFRYLKGQPKLGLWYPRDSPFDLEAYSNCDYARCKKQTIIATSTTKAAYVAAAHYYGQFWNTTISKTVNLVKQMHAIVNGKAVVVSESSIEK
nr:hypothetical protein [Tanacetum cinerariifolium]